MQVYALVMQLPILIILMHVNYVICLGLCMGPRQMTSNLPIKFYQDTWSLFLGDRSFGFGGAVQQGLFGVWCSRAMQFIGAVGGLWGCWWLSGPVGAVGGHWGPLGALGAAGGCWGPLLVIASRLGREGAVFAMKPAVAVWDYQWHVFNNACDCVRLTKIDLIFVYKGDNWHPNWAFCHQALHAAQKGIWKTSTFLFWAITNILMCEC